MTEVLLSDICELIVDCPHSTAVDEGNGYPLVRTPNIGKGRLIYQGMHRVSEDVYLQRNKRATPQEDDLIFAREATAGNVALIQQGEKVCLGQRTVLIRPNKALVNPAFLTYFLLAPKQQYNLLSTANGATVAHVNLPTIRNLKLELPDLAVQRRIAEALSRYDALIENYQRQIKLLEEAAQRLYKEWFVDLRFPGHQSTPIINNLPQSWQKKKLGEIGKVITGKTPSTSKKENYGGSIPFITIPDMHNGIYPDSSLFLSDIGANSQRGKFIPPNSLMVSCIGTAGLVCISKENCQTNQQINTLVLEDKGALYYLYFVLRSLKEHLVNLGSNGATMTNVNKTKFESIEIMFPCKSLIESFYVEVKNHFECIKNLSYQIRNLSEARDRLLPKLMNAEIEV
jgi:type I restriction enzyme S subunit